MEELSLQMSLQAGAQYTIGYTEQRGRGRLTVIGLTPSPELLVAIYADLAVRIPSRSVTPRVSTALFHRGQEFYLVAVNAGNEDKTADVHLTADFSAFPCWHVRNLVTREEWMADVRGGGRLTFPLSRKDGVILHIEGMEP